MNMQSRNVNTEENAQVLGERKLMAPSDGQNSTLAKVKPTIKLFFSK